MFFIHFNQTYHVHTNVPCWFHWNQPCIMVIHTWIGFNELLNRRMNQWMTFDSFCISVFVVFLFSSKSFIFLLLLFYFSFLLFQFKYFVWLIIAKDSLESAEPLTIELLIFILTFHGKKVHIHPFITFAFLIKKIAFLLCIIIMTTTTMMMMMLMI